MNCLRMDQIYLYLEKELSPSETKGIEEHLVSCSKCQNAVAERRLLLRASESLPLWDPPADFSRQVMAHIFPDIFPDRVSIRKWIVASAVGFSSAALAFLAYFVFSGQSLLSFLTGLGRGALDLFRTVSVLVLKLVKLGSLLIRVIVRIFEILIQFFGHLTKMISPEMQIILITLTLILSVSLFFGVKRKYLTGEKA